MSNRRFLFVVLLLAFGLRAPGLIERSLWLDEFTSLDVAGRGLGEMLWGGNFDWHTPPLYYLLLNLWFSAIPENEFGLRSFSLILNLATIGVALSVFSRQFGPTAGRYTALLLALSPFSIYYAQEGRMYALLELESLLTYALLLQARDKAADLRHYLALLLIGTAGMYTHYYYAFFLAAMGLWSLYITRKDTRTLLSLTATFALISLLFLPWLGVVLSLLGQGGQSFRRFVLSVLPYTLLRFSAGYGVMPLTTSAKEAMRETVLTHLPLVGTYLVVFTVAGLRGLILGFRRARAETAFLLPALLMPAVLGLLISIAMPMLSERYLIVSYPFFIALPAVLGSEDRENSRTNRILFYSVILLFGYGVFQHYFNPRFGNTDWRSAAEVLQENERCKQVLINPPYLAGLIDYYMPDDWSVIVQSADETPAELLSRAAGSCGGFWLLERGTAESLFSEFSAGEASVEQTFHSPLENEIYGWYVNQ